MYETLFQEMERLYPQKGLLTVEEICEFLSCDKETVYNWTKRSNRKRQPPRLMIGKTLRFPKKDFAKWLSEEQLRGSMMVGQ
jgi:excisionase family DNA binding protein